MTDARDRIDELLKEAIRNEKIEPQLDAILRDLVDVIDAEPELRRALIRDGLRSRIMSSMWMRSA